MNEKYLAYLSLRLLRQQGEIKRTVSFCGELKEALIELHDKISSEQKSLDTSGESIKPRDCQ